jgi:hypothetical protein
LFGGVTGSGSSFITSFLIATGQSLWQSVITTALITETVDKFVSVFIVFFIIKAIPARTLLKFPLSKHYVRLEIRVDPALAGSPFIRSMHFMLERKKGPLSKLYPLTKLVFLLCAIILAIVFDWKFGYLVMVPLTLDSCCIFRKFL